MEKEYFYLDGKDQKGPFSIEELKAANLKLNTLVWTEGMDNWAEAKDVKELKDKFKPIPPPPPIIQKSDPYPTLEDSNVKDWITFKILVVVVVSLVLG